TMSPQTNHDLALALNAASQLLQQYENQLQALQPSVDRIKASDTRDQLSAQLQSVDHALQETLEALRQLSPALLATFTKPEHYEDIKPGLKQFLGKAKDDLLRAKREDFERLKSEVQGQVEQAKGRFGFLEQAFQEAINQAFKPKDEPTGVVRQRLRKFQPTV